MSGPIAAGEASVGTTNEVAKQREPDDPEGVKRSDGHKENPDAVTSGETSSSFLPPALLMRINKKEDEDEEDDDAEDVAAEDQRIKLLVKHSPSSGWRASLRHYLFPRTENKMRRAAGMPVLNSRKTILVDWFDAVILVLVLANTIMLALQDPLYPESELMVTLRALNNVFSLLYAVEFTIRVLAFGFILFRSEWWNIFDFLIVFFGIVTAIVDIAGVKQVNVNAIRTVIVFRPLRSIRYVDTARITVRATVRAIRSIGDVGILFVLFVVLFAVSGVSQYNGRLRYRCVNNDFFLPNATNSTETANFTMEDFIRWQAYDQYKLSLKVKEWEGLMWEYECKQLFYENGSEALVAPGGISFTSPPRIDLDLTVFRYVLNCSVFLQNLTNSSTSILNLEPVMQNEYLGALNKTIQGPEPWEVAMWQNQTCDPTDAIILYGFRCPHDYTCASYKNPYFSNSGFDNLPKALLTAFAVVTDEPWYEFMYLMMDAVDVTASVYFVTLMVVGSFFFVNLLVVLLMVEFNTCVSEERKKLKESVKDGSVGGLKMLGQLLREAFTPKPVSGGKDALEKAEVKSDRVDRSSVSGDEAQAVDNRHDKSSTASGDDGRASEAKTKEEVDEDENDDDLFLDDEEMDEMMIDPATGQLLPSSTSRRRKKKNAKEGVAAVSSVTLLRRRMYDLLKSPRGMIITNSAILGNIVIMAMSYYGMSRSYASALDDANLGFIIYFTVELVYRLICTDIWVFVTNSMSVLDVVIVIVSWLDVGFSSFQAPIVRGLRVIRLLNIFKPFPMMYKWIKIILKSIKSASVLFVICLFVTFVFACMGMTFFGGKVCNASFADTRPNNNVLFCPNRPRSNYDTFVQAMITTFLLMTGDNWHTIMFAIMRGTSDAAAVYFVLAFIGLNMILSNLLIGLLQSVRTQSDMEDLQEELAAQQRKEQARNEGRLDIVAEEEEKERQRKRKLQLLSIVFDEDDESETQQQAYQYTAKEVWLQSLVDSTIWRFSIMIILVINSACLSLQSPISAPNTPYRTLLNIMDIFTNVLFCIEMLVSIVAYGFLSHKETYLRRDRWNIFDFIIMILFILTETLDLLTAQNSQTQIKSVGKALRGLRPLRIISRSAGLKSIINSLANSLEPLGNLFLVLLTIMTLYGIMGVQIFQGSFYSCENNITAVDEVDCLAQGRQWVNSNFHFDNLPQAYLSLLVMSTVEGWIDIMYSGMDAVGPGKSPIVDAQRVNSLYFISFMVIGSMFFVNFFVSIIIDTYQRTNRLDPYRKNRFLTPGQTAWIRSHHTFLHHVSIVDYDDPTNTYEAFGDNDGQQAAGEGVGGASLPSEFRPEYSLLNRVRMRLRSLVRHPIFDTCVYGLITVNFLIMAVEHYPATAIMRIFTNIANIFFSGLFVIEMILKIIVESPKGYLKSKWNRFDAVIVTLSVIALIVENVFANTTFVSTFRALRVARMLRLLRKSRRLQSVVKKFLFALYSLNNISMVLFLVIFCYGVIGMNLFGRVHWNGVLHHQANFENIFTAGLMMLRVATGGDWGRLLVACSAQPPNCSLNQGDCGSPIGSLIFFVSFVLITMFLLMNVFVAVILEVFTTLADDFVTMSDYECGQFMKLWFHFDPERTYRMESKFLLTLLRFIPPDCVIGMGPVPKRRRLQHEYVFVESLGLKEFHGKIELQDLIACLCQATYGRKSRLLRRNNHSEGQSDESSSDGDSGALVVLPEERRRRLQDKADRHFRRVRRDRYKPGGKEFDVAYRVAAQIFEAYWHRRKFVRAQMEEVRIRARMRDHELVSLMRRLEDDPVIKIQSKEAKAVAAKKKPVAANSVLSPSKQQPTLTALVETMKDEQNHQQSLLQPEVAMPTSSDPYQLLLLARRAADAADPERELHSVAPLQTGVASQFRVRSKPAGESQPIDAYGLDIFTALVEEEKALRRRAEQSSRSGSVSSVGASSSNGAAQKPAATAMAERIAYLLRNEGVTQPSADDTTLLAHMVMAAWRAEEAREEVLHSLVSCSLPAEEEERGAIEETERVERGPLAVRALQLAQKYLAESEELL
jgi:hypothetical protein